MKGQEIDATNENTIIIIHPMNKIPIDEPIFVADSKPQHSSLKVTGNAENRDKHINEASKQAHQNIM